MLNLPQDDTVTVCVSSQPLVRNAYPCRCQCKLLLQPGMLIWHVYFQQDLQHQPMLDCLGTRQEHCCHILCWAMNGGCIHNQIEMFDCIWWKYFFSSVTFVKVRQILAKPRESVFLTTSNSSFPDTHQICWPKMPTTGAIQPVGCLLHVVFWNSSRHFTCCFVM